MTSWLDDLAAQLLRDMAAQREAALERVVRSYLPKRLRWGAGHARLLRGLYLLRPSWRPIIHVGQDLGTTVHTVMGANGEVVVLGVTQTIQTERTA